MTQTPRSTLTTTRLVSVLQGLGMPGETPSQRDVVNRFGRMIDLAYSVNLADRLRQIERGEVSAPAAADEGGDEDPTAVLLEVRRSVIEYVAVSFSVDNSIAMPFRFPKPAAEAMTDPQKAAAPYQRFYVLHQGEMDFRVLRLRKQMRAMLGQRGVLGTRLLALDEVLNDTLARHARKALTTVPRLLAKRFVTLAAAHRDAAGEDAGAPADWMKPGNWLARFRDETEEMLLAELDLRLHPLLGLIEAAATEEDFQ